MSDCDSEVLIVRQPVGWFEIEQAFLGALFAKPQSIYDVIALVRVDDFYEPLHGHIYQAMMILAERKHPITRESVGNQLIHQPAVGNLTPMQYLGRLAANATTANVQHYAGLVRDLGVRRRLVNVAADLIRHSPDAGIPAGDIAGNAITLLEQSLSDLRPRQNTIASIQSISRSVIDKLRRGEKTVFIPTGLGGLDDVMGGYERGEMHIIAARPSMGKTAVALSSALASAKKGVNILMFSLEMAHAQLGSRLLSDLVWNSQTPIPYSHIIRHKVDEVGIDRLDEVLEVPIQGDFTIDEQSGLSAAEIVAKCRQHAARLARVGKTLDVVIVDHLGLVRASALYAGKKVDELGDISINLRNMAKDLNVALIALHQLNRGVEGREEKVPGLSDLRDSGNLEQDAGFVAFLYRPAYYLERWKSDDVETEEVRRSKLDEVKNRLDFVIAKARNGPCCAVELWCDMASNVVRSLAQGR